MRPPACWILPLVLTSLALGQAAPARRLQQARTSLAPGSDAWFENGFDLVEAQLKFDVAGAARTAAELQAAARSSPLPDVAAVAHALAGFAEAALRGPDAAADVPKESTPPLTAAASVRNRARYYTARARHAYYADVPAEFLPDMFTALEAARAAGDPALLHRAVWTLHGVLERDSAAHDAELLREIAVTATAPAVAPFAAWRALQEYWLASSRFTRDERLRQLDDIDRLADALGDLRTHVHVAWDRVVIELAGDEKDEAARILAEWLPRTERLGDCRVLGVHLELAAEVAMERERHEEAEALLARAGQVAGNRGFPDRDVHQAHLRLRLATGRGDAGSIATETKLLGRLRRDGDARYRGFTTMLERLLTDERQRLDLTRERDESARALRSVLITGLGFLAVASTLLTMLAWRSRRRLQHAHVAFQDQVRRGEQELAVRRTLEQRLRQVERTESLGLVAGGIAHDFNNLMVAVLGNADLLRADETDPQRARLLETIVAAGERGSRLCSQLQTYAGNQAVHTESFDLLTQLRGLAPVLAAAAGPSLQLSTPDAPEPLWLDGSSTEIEQAILNLVMNARDAKATRVSIRVSRRTMRDEDWQGHKVRGELGSGAFAAIEVEDDGEGMSAEVLERIFDPFFTTRFPGRGLGLAVVFGAVRHHRAAITVESEPGRGTRFCLYLPLRTGAETLPPAAAGAPPSPPTAATIAPMTVLVIDDESHVRELVASSLSRRGHRVIAIGDSRDLVAALPGLDRTERAIALVDLSMPGLDGRDVVRRLRQLHPGLPIALMSGHARAHLAEITRELGAAGSVSKPFRPVELERALDQALALQPQPTRRGA